MEPNSGELDDSGNVACSLQESVEAASQPSNVFSESDASEFFNYRNQAGWYGYQSVEEASFL